MKIKANRRYFTYLLFIVPLDQTHYFPECNCQRTFHTRISVLSAAASRHEKKEYFGELQSGDYCKCIPKGSEYKA